MQMRWRSDKDNENGLKIVVTGGRNFDDYEKLSVLLDALNFDCSIAHGGASGADFLAEYWAEVNRVDTYVFPAEWNKHGKSAGPIRNREMISTFKPHVVLAVDGNAGTKHCVSVALEHGIPVVKNLHEIAEFLVGGWGDK